LKPELEHLWKRDLGTGMKKTNGTEKKNHNENENVPQEEKKIGNVRIT
jgi:hypothetical protein